MNPVMLLQHITSTPECPCPRSGLRTRRVLRGKLHSPLIREWAPLPSLLIPAPPSLPPPPVSNRVLSIVNSRLTVLSSFNVFRVVRFSGQIRYSLNLMITQNSLPEDLITYTGAAQGEIGFKNLGIHYHIRWLDSSLDWKPFPTKEGATNLAEKIKRGNERYIIVERHGECERCKEFKLRATSQRAS